MRISGLQTITRGSASPKKYASSLPLSPLVPGVQRQVDQARAQAGQIERQRLPAFVDLDRDAIALFASCVDEHVRDLRGCRIEIVVVNDGPSRDEKARLVRVVGEMVAQQRVQVGVHPLIIPVLGTLPL